MQEETVYWVTWTLFGAIVGSFLNAFVYRWPRRISLVTRSRSFCPSCNATIAWYDNIPVVSYLLLVGRCRSCRNRIPIRYLVVEAITAGLFCLAYYQGRVARPDAGGWFFVVTASVLVAEFVALSFVDIETYTVPFVNSLGILAIGLALSLLWPHLQLGPTQWIGVARVDLALNSIQGAILGGGVVWAVGAAAELILRKEAMGGGDVKILAGVGAVFGWKAALAAFFVAVFVGATSGIAMILYDRLLQRFTSKRIGVKGIEKGITYEYDHDEPPPPPDKELVKSRRLMLIGTAIAVEQSLCLTLMPGPRESLLSAAPLLFGATLGLFIVFYDVVRRRLVNEGTWIKRDINTDADGKTAEHLAGHYLPFGPFLAVGALVMLFAGRPVLTWLAARFFPML